MVGWVAALVLGGPIVLLGASALMSTTARGKELVSRMALPEGASSYAAVIVQRWLSEPWTLLLLGILLTLAVAWLLELVGEQAISLGVSQDLVFVMVLSAIGLALIYAPEFIFLRDYFGSRMNTVFKFYYQGWLLLGISSAYFIVVALAEIRQRFGVVQGLGILSLILVVGSLLYPAAGIYAKTGGFSRTTPTFDATAYIAQNVPEVVAAANWIRANTTPDQRVLEGKGNSYAAHHNRISVMTGRPTLLGWDGHESQWRGDAYASMAEGRGQAIEMIYRTAPAGEIPALLGHWEIDYVFDGPSEIEMYGITPARLAELAEVMDVVFEQGEVRILRSRDR
jgi:uncharacterized membrane protein